MHVDASSTPRCAWDSSMRHVRLVLLTAFRNRPTYRRACNCKGRGGTAATADIKPASAAGATKNGQRKVHGATQILTEAVRAEKHIPSR